MLVLGRRPGETLCIGDNIVITVVGIQEGQVRIGIEAPRSVNILRGELVTPKTQAESSERKQA